MTRYVALLRAVNVAGHGKINMSELRQAFSALGYADVGTYIQSGNVVFTSDARVEGTELGRALAGELGAAVEVMLRTAAQMKTVVERNPFTEVDLSKVHVGFMSGRPSPSVVGALDVDRFKPEEARVAGSEVYFHLPNGMGRSKLPNYLTRQLKVPFTVRNWNTATKLRELSSSRPAL